MIAFFKTFYFNKKKNDIIQNSKIVNQYIRDAIKRDKLAEVKIWLEFIAKINKGKAWLVKKDGYLSSSYPFIQKRFINKNLPRYKEVFSGKVISKEVRAKIFPKPMLLTAIPIKKGINTEFALLIFTPVSGIKDTIEQVIKLMIYSSLLAVIMAVILSYTWSRNLSNPLQKISNFAIKLSKGNFGSTIEEEVTDSFQELDDLGKSINYMSLTLKDSIDKLVEEKNKLNYVLTGMEEGVIAVNTSGNVILANNAAEKLLKLERDKIRQKRYDQVIKNKDIQRMFTEVLQKKEIYNDEIFLQKNNIQAKILIHVTPIFINSNNFWGVVGLFQDISERWRFEQLQKEFTANVSHDLKAPLSSIKGATELLLDGIVDTAEKKRNYLQMIYNESNRLESLVEEVLELDVFDSRSSNMKCEKVEVNQLLTNMKIIYANILNKKELKIKTHISDKKIFVKGNLEKIKRVILNLMDNAYKFSPDSKIIELGAEENKENVKIWVKDNGIGIPRDELDNIWERFYKVDKARTPGQKGSGLGLAIVKHLVEAQGGSVFVESKLDEGSIFGFYLSKYSPSN